MTQKRLVVASERKAHGRCVDPDWLLRKD